MIAGLPRGPTDIQLMQLKFPEQLYFLPLYALTK
jgi:hypothetical protein